MNKDDFKGMKIILYADTKITLGEALDAIQKFKEGR